MNVVIIEDEKPAAEKLASELVKVKKDIQIIKIIHDVRTAIAYFKESEVCDLIFMDVELSDGLSFDIIKSVKMTTPIIFITAYDHYWQQAFALNGIDYLLKPVDLDNLEKALSKYKMIKKHFSARMDALVNYISGKQNVGYKEKFLVRRGKELVMVSCKEITCFKASHKVTVLLTADGSKLIVDYSLSKLEEILDPQIFTRANRAHIVNIDYIEKIEVLSKGKLGIRIQSGKSDYIIISQERALGFRNWAEGLLK